MYYRDDPYSTEALYSAYLKAKKASNWKGSTQKYNHDFLYQIQELSDDIQNGTYQTGQVSQFTISERGKTRLVCGNTVRDRVARHALCDNVLMPAIQKKIVYDNAASQTGKGTKFCRDRLKQHLHEYYRKHGNQGYILIGDIKKYYDNIDHRIAVEQLTPFLDDASKKLLDEVIGRMKVDVSMMSEQEYQQALKTFDSVDFFRKYRNQGKTGERYLYKSMRTGDQTAQIIGIYYLHTLDNLIQIVHGYRYYGRFNDDFYVIAETKEELKVLLEDIRKTLSKLGLKLNEKKTVICKIDRPFKFMQCKYWVTDTGRVPEKINKKNIQRERVKLKKLKKQGIPYKEAENQFKSWIGSYHKTMSKKQIKNMNNLFDTLFKEKKDEG